MLSPSSYIYNLSSMAPKKATQYVLLCNCVWHTVHTYPHSVSSSTTKFATGLHHAVSTSGLWKAAPCRLIGMMADTIGLALLCSAVVRGLRQQGKEYLYRTLYVTAFYRHPGDASTATCNTLRPILHQTTPLSQSMFPDATNQFMQAHLTNEDCWCMLIPFPSYHTQLCYSH